MFDKTIVSKIIPTLNFKFPYDIDDFCKNMYLENYHSHKYGSNAMTQDSPTSLEDYVQRIKEFNGKCLYTMEHGWQGLWPKAYNLSEQNDLKFIYGTEAYWVKDRHESDKTNCHMVIHATCDEGRKDINYALSMANIDGYYYKPRIDLDLLFQIPKKNVIVTSACVAGWLYDDAEDIWKRVHDYFGNNFFLEVQNHNTDKQKRLNEKILRMAEREGIQTICGLDSHYIHPEDSELRDQILAYKNIHYEDEEGWYMDYPSTEEVVRRFKEQGVLSDEEITRAIMNTNIFASDYVEKIVLNRDFKIPTVYPDKTYEEKCKIYKDILNEEYKKDPYKSKEKVKGIRYEASQIIESGVVDYFLTSRAIVKHAVNDCGGVLTTTSRGSSASFITNKMMGLTTVDRFNADVPMYPERFLTKDRVLAHQLPDIDLNISAQEPFIRASRDLLGEHGCYPLIAISVLKEKSAWQLYASNSGIAPSVANKISKYIDDYNMAVKHASDDEKDNISIKDYIPTEYYDTYMESRNYQSILSGLRVHACACLLLNGDIRREIGLVSAVSEATKKRTICAAMEGTYLDEFGYVKEDFLIVDSVDLTHKFFQALGKPVPTFQELREMVKDDKATWDIYAKGITCCINQCEQSGTVGKVMKYKPNTMAELSQFIAAIRPGFASLLNTFLNRQPYSTGEQRIDELLEDTSHFMLLQESIMKVLGFLHLPMSETYGVIKSISKKKLKGEKKEKLLAELKQAWLEEFGNLDNFDKVWQVVSDAARYSFNCLTGDTEIRRPNGSTISLEQLSKIKNGKYGYGLSLDGMNHVSKNKILEVIEQGFARVYKITLVNGQSVKATENHRFMVRDGLKRFRAVKVSDLDIFHDEILCIDYGSEVSWYLIQKIEVGNNEMVYDVSMSGKVSHTFALGNGIISHNSSHSWSMCGDSVYQAWFKAHHTDLFYSVAIKHYQEKGKKDKIDALIKEAIKYFGYKLGDYRFGDDNRTIHIENKIIYPNISSIKGIGERVGIILYKLGQDKYNSFYDVLNALYSNGIDTTTVYNLIRINYFKKYGGGKKLLKEWELFEFFKRGSMKEIMKDKAESFGLSREFMLAHGSETAKKYKINNCMELINDITTIIPDEDFGTVGTLVNENDVLGVVKTVIPTYPKNRYLLCSVDQNKSVTTMQFYEIFSGKMRDVKMWNNSFNKSELQPNQLVKLVNVSKEAKREPTGEINPVTGKKVYAPSKDKFEYWLKSYEILS